MVWNPACRTGRGRRLARIAAAAVGAAAVGLLSAGATSANASISVPCTGQADLVAAINAANAAGGGTISLATGCDYLLTSVDNSGENGLPVVTTPISVNGNGATIDGTGAVRVFEVDGPGGSLSLRNATITGGSAFDFGGAIANMGGTVALNHSRVTGNSAVAAGGGIASATIDPSSVAKLTLNQSSVSDNRQTLDGLDGGLGGGGILNVVGSVSLNQSQVDGNTAEGFVGGGIANGDYFNFSSSDSLLTVNGSEVNDNNAPNAGGGGIQNLLGTATINNSRVNGNTSLNGGGISSGNGNGGIPPGTAHLMLNNSQVSGNTATAPAPQPGSMSGPPIAAGGIANGSDAVLNNTEVDNNTASHTSGGGIVNHGTMTLNNSEVNNNRAAGTGLLASGGGILSAQGPPGSGTTTLSLNNTFVQGNRAGGDGGGIANGVPFPGPMPLPGGLLTLHNSVVTGNTAAHGGGIFNNLGTVTLSNTTVTGNVIDNCEPLNTITGCTG